MKKAIYVDMDLCLGCRSCEIGCATAHSESKVLVEAINEKKSSFSRITIDTKKNGDKIALYCRHCEKAACMDACGPKAIERDAEGAPVRLLADKCTGSQSCIKACHFGIVVAGSDGKTRERCDLCTDRENGPACVESCPTKAIELLSDEEVKAKIDYVVDDDTCTKCGLCFKKCPYDAITWKKKELAVIHEEKCVRCGLCTIVCKSSSIINKKKVNEKV
ncbi:MAG: 4Fe-4S dicluster domain-containing protein [Fibrobacteria bacterium]|nr:4Fe-4S dicluster domain-containing protein [Fibrobacteria bacterium]